MTPKEFENLVTQMYLLAITSSAIGGSLEDAKKAKELMKRVIVEYTDIWERLDNINEDAMGRDY